MKKLHRLSAFLLLLAFASLLVACGRASDIPTPPPDSVGKILRPTPTPVLNPNEVLPTVVPPTPVSVEPTVTPLGSPSGQPQPASSGENLQGSNPLDPNNPAELPVGAGDGSNSAYSTGLNADNLPQEGGDSLHLSFTPGSAAAPAPAQKGNNGAKGQPRIGIQAGHWLTQAVPLELDRLRTETGGFAAGVKEVDVNLALARLVARDLEAKGYEVDLLPTTIPPNYTADAFVAIHADTSDSTTMSGYKLARSRNSAIPLTDNSLLSAISAAYGKATGLSLSDTVTPNMTNYYAFDNRHSRYAVTKITPAVILETGFLTNSLDRLYLTGEQPLVAEGIANGVADFIAHRPPLEMREKPADTMPGVEASEDGVPLLDKPGGKTIGTAKKGQRFENYGQKDDYYLIWVADLHKPAFIAKDKVSLVTIPR